MAKYTDKKKSSTNQQEVPVSKKFKSIKKKNKMENGKVAKNYVKKFTDINGNKNRILKTEDAAVSVKSKKIVKAEGDEIFSSLFLKYKPRSTPHVASGSDWVAQLIEEEKVDKPISLHSRQKYKELAEKIFNDDVQAYELIKEKRNQNQNGLYHKKVLSHGTTKDKMAAYSVQCMESPVYSVSDLFSLIEFISPRCKVNCKEAVDNILHLLKAALLPKHYVAKEFECHNFLALKPLLKTNPEKFEKQLVLWYFESQIRLAYLKVVENLEKLCHDSNTKLKSVGIRGLQNLLLAHPEQDAEIILRKLVNKLGDTNKQVAGDVLNVLSNIQLARPQLKTVLISLVEEMLYRPNISFKSQYYGLCFLKDIVITRGDAALVEKLIKLYFEFFQSSSKAGEVDSRFMGAILRGLNRAFPFFGDRDIPTVEAQIGTLYKLCHVVGFNVATQALQLIYQVQSSITEETCDRFYSLLYAKLLEPCFGASSANGAFLNLVFKAMVRDPCCARVRAFVRRMLQICKYHPPHMLCATLFLVSEAVKDNDSFADLNDLFLTQENTEEGPEGDLDEEEDDLEYYPDIDTDEEDSKGDRSNGLSDLSVSPVKSPASPQGDKKAFVKTESSWLHRDNWGKDKDKKGLLRTKDYDPSKRNPLYSGAELSPLWELRELANHYHPTVALFATNLLDAVHISYAGDPLQDFTLMRFLNRFTQRNPKKVSVVKNKLSTIMGSHAQYHPRGARGLSVGSKDFKKQLKGNVAAEDLFLYNYFTKYVKTPDEPSKRPSRKDDDDVSDDEFDEYLRNMKGFRDSGMDPAADDDEDFDFANSAQYAEGLDMDSDVEEDDEDDEDEDEDNDYDDIEDNEDEIEGGIMSDEDVEEGETDDEEEEEADDEEEEEDIDDESLSEEEEEEIRPAAKKRNVKRWKPSGDSGWRGMLADADEFSSLLEGNADADPLAGTSEAVFNRDKSHAKQLKWEKKRDEYLQKSSQGFSGRSGRSSGSRSGRQDRSTSRPRSSNFKASRGGRKGRK